MGNLVDPLYYELTSSPKKRAEAHLSSITKTVQYSSNFFGGFL